MTSPPSPIEPDGLLDGLRWSAIFRGALVDLVATFVGGILLLIFLFPAEALEEGAAGDRALDAAMVTPEGLFWTAVVGFAGTVCGGYYGARRAGTHPVRHGGWVAVASLLITFPFLLTPLGETSAPAPAWYDALGIALMLPAGVLGGFLASLREGER